MNIGTLAKNITYSVPQGPASVRSLGEVTAKLICVPGYSISLGRNLISIPSNPKKDAIKYAVLIGGEALIKYSIWYKVVYSLINQ